MWGHGCEKPGLVREPSQRWVVPYSINAKETYKEAARKKALHSLNLATGILLIFAPSILPTLK